MADEPNWSALREAYEAGDATLNAMAAKFGTSARAIIERARRCKWSGGLRADEVDRRLLIRRLMWALEQRIDLMGESMNTGTDKEAALLGSLSRTLEKLIDLDKREAGGRELHVETAEMRDIRSKLEKRIDALTKR